MKSSDKAVKDYFSALLDEPKPTPIAVFSPLQKLLDGVKSDDSLLREDVKPERIKTSQVETFSPTFAEPLKFPTIQEISEQVIQDPPKVSDSLLATSAVGSPTIDEPLSESDRQIALAVGPGLAKKGLMLVGLDVIGRSLTEVNVTSPTCFREIHDQTGFSVADAFVQAIEVSVGQTKMAGG